MSFILDALRKSDAERQRAVTPGLADVRYAARRPKRNIWLPILAVVLAANIVFMGVQWFAGQRAGPAGGSTVQGAPVAGPPATPLPDAPAGDIRPLSREADFSEPELMVDNRYAGAPPPVPAPVISEVAEPPLPTGTAAEPAPRPGTPGTEAPASGPAPVSRILAGNDLPTAEELIGKGELDIPLLNLDLHVYSEQPGSRFVVINTRKYKEGGQLTEGPTIESITRDGVILASKGRRFTLSRK